MKRETISPEETDIILRKIENGRFSDKKQEKYNIILSCVLKEAKEFEKFLEEVSEPNKCAIIKSIANFEKLRANVYGEVYKRIGHLGIIDVAFITQATFKILKKLHAKYWERDNLSSIADDDE